MSCRISFETDNDAFRSSGQLEVGRLLRVVAARIEDGETDGTVIDYNDNKVGIWEVQLDSCDEDQEDDDHEPEED